MKQQRYEIEGMSGYIAVCVNEKERQATWERRYDEIDEALKRLGEKEPIKNGLRKYLRETRINHVAL
jgi:hypothetical protein